MTAARRLGNQGLEVSPIGLGCMSMTGWTMPGDQPAGGVYGPPDEREAIATIHRAIDLGVTFLDTAEIYGPHLSEQLIGRAIAGRRDEVTLATKFGLGLHGESEHYLNGDPAYVRQACERSLSNLGTDRIDLYYQHRLDRTVPIEETMGALSELVKEGKILYVGLSEMGAERIRRAHAVHPLSAVQTEYSLWERSLEAEILPTMRELGIGLVAYSPLGRGFLAGAVTSLDDLAPDDYRRQDPRFFPENLPGNLAIAAGVRSVAAQLGATPAQVALAWTLAKGEDVVPIPGAKRRPHLEENAAAAAIVLSATDVAELDGLIERGVTGERYAGEALTAVID
ncbi:MAG: aldo/keto reductase [Actinobacteria bacterium]|nr:aldo/keto reductase [Actinomycetota bacterium]